MLPFLFSLVAAQGPDIRTLDDLAEKRDVATLTAYLTPDSLKRINPLQVLKTHGAYETGRRGWDVVELMPPDGSKSYVVFTTPMTTEDVGEMVFERQGAALKYVPEDDPLGVRITRHKFDVGFDIPHKTTTISDDLSLRKIGAPGPHFFIRFSPYLHIDSITRGGMDVPFSQAGGTTAISTSAAFGSSTETVLQVTYHGVVDLPQYAGSITDNEAQLTNDYWYPMIARLPAPYEITVHTPKGWMAVGQGEEVSR
ncbi:MAG: hypothetical protein QOJ65_623, partial [Fimbriimonadaceae bacterium]|nr:hypothetical protein [Fimbriimonadaceae bacterium]